MRPAESHGSAGPSGAGPAFTVGPHVVFRRDDRCGRQRGVITLEKAEIIRYTPGERR